MVERRSSRGDFVSEWTPRLNSPPPQIIAQMYFSPIPAHRDRFISGLDDEGLFRGSATEGELRRLSLPISRSPRGDCDAAEVVEIIFTAKFTRALRSGRYVWDSPSPRGESLEQEHSSLPSRNYPVTAVLRIRFSGVRLSSFTIGCHSLRGIMRVASISTWRSMMPIASASLSRGQELMSQPKRQNQRICGCTSHSKPTGLGVDVP